MLGNCLLQVVGEVMPLLLQEFSLLRRRGDASDERLVGISIEQLRGLAHQPSFTSLGCD